MDIMSDYSPNFTMKSIDEGVIDFSASSAAIRGRDMEDIGREIKQRLRDEVGCAMRCNVGISTNRFLAKTAAGLHKPDGMDILTSHNIRQVFDRLTLMDLTGIAVRNEHRLNMVGIYTPLQFLDAAPELLAKVVFKSVCGYQWHQRLRGWEVDDVQYDLKTAGRQYVLERRDLPRSEVFARLHTLAEATGVKLRSQGKSARGVGIYARMYGVEGLGESNGRWGRKGNYWHKTYLAPLPFFSDRAIWAIASRLFAGAPQGDIREIGMHVYHLHDSLGDQLTLFGDELAREQQVTWAIDDINARYGERTIHSADTLGGSEIVKTKIPFGSTRYL
jgi:DNA polymerase-4